MSYNIDTFKLKSVKLVLPKGFSMIAFCERTGAWEPEDDIAVSSDLTSWEFNENGEGFSMSGHVCDDELHVQDVHCWGEGSGAEYKSILIPLFTEFQGDLEAVCVWEGGDSIERITIINGEVTEEEIDL